MTDSEYDLLQVQIGKEATWGNPIAPTAKLAAVTDFRMNPEITIHRAEEMRGSLQKHFTAQIMGVKAAATIDFDATFEDICYFFDGMFGDATPTGTDPYLRAYDAPSSKPTLRESTYVLGGPEGVYGLAGALCSRIALGCATGENMSGSADIVGKVIAADVLATLSDRTVNLIAAQMFTLYIDAEGGTIGTTEIENTAFQFDLELNSNIDTKQYLGSISAGGYKQPGWEGSLKLVLELNTISKAYLDSLLSTALKHQIRLVAADTANRNYQLDFAGVVTNSPDIFGERDGVAIVELEYEDLYNSSLGNWFESIVANQVATLP